MSDDRPPFSRLPVTPRDSFMSDPFFESEREFLDQFRHDMSNLSITDSNISFPSPGEMYSLFNRLHEEIEQQTLQPATIFQDPQTVPIPSVSMAPTQHQYCGMSANVPEPDPTYGTSVGSPTEKQTLAIVQTPAAHPAVLQSPTVMPPTAFKQSPAVMQPSAIVQIPVVIQQPGVKQPPAVQPNRYKFILDMKGFRPEEIVVTVDDNIIDITADQEKIQGCTTSSRSIRRRYTLPSNVIPKTIQCDLSCDGVLVISAPWAF